VTSITSLIYNVMNATRTIELDHKKTAANTIMIFVWQQYS